MVEAETEVEADTVLIAEADTVLIAEPMAVAMPMAIVDAFAFGIYQSILEELLSGQVAVERHFFDLSPQRQ